MAVYVFGFIVLVRDGEIERKMKRPLSDSGSIFKQVRVV